MTAVLLAVGLVALAVGLYPYVGYPLMLRMLPTRPIADAPREGLRITLFFAAYNEIAVIEKKIANCEELRKAFDLDVFAYDDASSDGTRELLEQAPGIRLFRGAGRTGKAHGMKLMAATAASEVLVFTDADVLVPTESLQALVRPFADPTVGGVAGHLTHGLTLGEATSIEATGSQYSGIESGIRARESSTGNVMGADGGLFAVRRELYPDDFPDDIQDDFRVSMGVVFSGHRLVFANDAWAPENPATQSRDELRRKVRIASRAAATHRAMRPYLSQMRAVDRWKYASHKILRWVSAYFLVAGAVMLLAAGLLLAPISALIVAAVGLVLALLLVRRRLPAVVFAALAVMATAYGYTKGRLGLHASTWTPPTSRRR